MRYAEIKCPDIANGPGCRVTIWVQGCNRHCEGCFNPESWDFEGGKPFDDDAYHTIIEALRRPEIHGLTVVGGEPLAQDKMLVCLLADVRANFPDRTIWVYTGYRWEELSEEQKDMLESVDVLVDGDFEEDKKIIDLRFRGSTNQRFIDVQRSLKGNCVIEATLPEYETEDNYGINHYDI